jgi:hypothetical protein
VDEEDLALIDGLSRGIDVTRLTDKIVRIIYWPWATVESPAWPVECRAMTTEEGGIVVENEGNGESC